MVREDISSKQGQITRKDSDSSTASLSPDNSVGRPSLESEQAVGGTRADNVLIGQRNLEELLNNVPYNTCPEFAYNHPLIQGALVFDAELGATPLIKARAFYLLHIVYNNMQLRTANEMGDEGLKNLSKNALERSKSLLPEISEEVFNEHAKEWRKNFIDIERSEDEKGRLQSLIGIENRFFPDQKEKWNQYNTIYDQLSQKYVYESIELAKAAFRKDLVTKIPPKEFLKHANSLYYAEGCIKMAEYLRTLAVGDVGKKENYLELARNLYKKALLEFDDIRGYEHLQRMESTIDEEVRIKWQELKPIYDNLERRLLTLFSNDPL
jgi:hypothetical protein